MITSARRAAADDRGSLALFTAMTAAALLALVVLVVDGAGLNRAVRQAHVTAAEAARRGAQAIDPPASVRGQPPVVDPAAAAAEAAAYLSAVAAADPVTGTVTVNDTTLTVQTQVTYHPALMSFIGLGGGLSVDGQAEARLTRSLDGQEQ